MGGNVVWCLKALSVPGSKGSELVGWHGEEWDIAGWGECFIFFDKTAGAYTWDKGSVSIIETGSSTSGVLHGVDLPVGTEDTKRWGSSGL